MLALALTRPMSGGAPSHAWEEARTSESFRFIVFGDTRGDGPANPINMTILAELVEASLAEEAAFILVAGDLVYGASDHDSLVSHLTQWRTAMLPLYDAGIGVYPCRGNHDAGDKAAWDEVFSGDFGLPGNGPVGEENVTFAFDYAATLIVGLDQYGTHSGRVNQQWLDMVFAAGSHRHVFVFGHQPAFKVHHADCLDDYPSDRDAFWSSLRAEGARVYFCGHDHMYNHALIDDGDGAADNDLHQFVSGAGGAPLRDWDGVYDGDNGAMTPHLVKHEKQFGYSLVVVDGDAVTITWKHRTAPGVYEATDDAFSYGVPGCHVDADCFDGLFCTGQESCVDNACVAGTPPDADDGVACTTDSCDEENNRILHTPEDSMCDDGIFCNGTEVCDTQIGCHEGSAPCSDPGFPRCDEDAGACLECLAIGDSNGDGQVGLPDLAQFLTCRIGPTRVRGTGPDPPACACLDADRDGNIDLSDFAAFQVNFTGP